MASTQLRERPATGGGVLAALNGAWHRPALQIFLAIVLLHWVEHVLQAWQVYVLGWPRPHAQGALGLHFPWLVSSESLHYGYALVMLAGFVLLRRGFTGRSRTWWDVALGIQIWHHFEHALLLGQVATGLHLLGREMPTSVIQLLLPRMELHLAYNALVFVPMVVAMLRHRRPSPAEVHSVRCTCAPALRSELSPT